MIELRVLPRSSRPPLRAWAARRAALAAALALVASACATAPTPSSKPEPWTYVDTRLPPNWWYSRVDASGARAKSSGGDRRIALVDTGVLVGHEDLPNLAPTVVACGVDGATATDVNGHGTQLAGIAAGKDPGHATRGMAPGARIIPIKVGCGLLTAAALVKGVDRAIELEADVVLIAVGGYPAGTPDVHTQLADRIRKSPRTLFVVASVWDGVAFAFPEWTRLDNVLVTAAMTLDNQGAEVPFGGWRGDIWAPGRDVDTSDILPDPDDPSLHQRYWMQGTSAASAVVAGCAALVQDRARQPGAAIKTALVQAADPQPALGSTRNGRLNCSRAIP